MRSTHTYALCEVSKSAYDEIRAKLIEAGYEDQMHDDDGKIVIDMHGIALAEQSSPVIIPARLHHEDVAGVIETGGVYQHIKVEWL